MIAYTNYSLLQIGAIANKLYLPKHFLFFANICLALLQCLLASRIACSHYPLVRAMGRHCYHPSPLRPCLVCSHPCGCILGTRFSLLIVCLPFGLILSATTSTAWRTMWHFFSSWCAQTNWMLRLQFFFDCSNSRDPPRLLHSVYGRDVLSWILFFCYKIWQNESFMHFRL